MWANVNILVHRKNHKVKLLIDDVTTSKHVKYFFLHWRICWKFVVVTRLYSGKDSSNFERIPEELFSRPRKTVVTNILWAYMLHQRVICCCYNVSTCSLETWSDIQIGTWCSVESCSKRLKLYELCVCMLRLCFICLYCPENSNKTW